MPETTPEFVCDLPTLPQAALIYRLSGDYNPLHADPAHAQKVGFKMPILHGRGTFGVAGHAILKTLCGYDPARFVSMEGRFSSPSIPAKPYAPRCGRTATSFPSRRPCPRAG